MFNISSYQLVWVLGIPSKSRGWVLRETNERVWKCGGDIMSRKDVSFERAGGRDSVLAVLFLVLALAISWALASSPAWAEQEPGELAPGATADPQEAGERERGQEEETETPGFEKTITVTGTRFKGRSATEGPAPVDYVDYETIRSTGATETGKILQLLAPSFNFSSTTISDGTDIIRPATLRALGPDQVLVLINGKRRHQQALLNVQQTIARGSAGYDLNAIPASAIDHIEILRDGAAAQYGSDAIAGVINIILKDDIDRTEVVLDGGQHYAGDGEVFMTGVNTGFSLGGQSKVNLTVDYRDRGETNRAGIDTLRVDPPYVTQRIGDADSENVAVWLNALFPVGLNEIYAFGGWSNRKGNSSGFFRSAGDGRTIPAIYPDGFLPTLITEPTDTALTVGYRGFAGVLWTYDLSATFGSSEFKFREENTANVSYWYEPIDPTDPFGERYEESLTAADTGTLKFEQTTLNADMTGVIDEVFQGKPLSVAVGAEWRRDGFEIEPGDPISYRYGRTDDRSIPIYDQTGAIAQPGTQGFPGFSPREAVDDSRSNYSLYADFEMPFSDDFFGGLALRFEDYSDFGTTLNGKLSARVKLSDTVSLRATASTGFRAPSVHQSFYSQRSTNLNAEGVLTDTLTARQDGELTRSFGIPALEEETSLNFAAGLVVQPSQRFRLTVDLYRIDIDDRIVFSSNIQPEDPALCGVPIDPDLCPIRERLDPLGIGQVLFFTNAIDTETTGLDIVAWYDFQLGDKGHVALQGAFHFNDTEVTARRSSSDILPAEALFDQAQITLVEEGQPSEHFVLSATYYIGDWSTNVRLNYFGEVAGEGFTPGFKQTWGAKVLTDLSIKYSFNDSLSLTVGGLNIFDEFPDKWDPVRAFPFPQLGFVYGWETLPFGMNGGYYFVRFNARLDH